MSTDPRQIIEESAMTRLQYMIIALTVGLNALDGFDVLAISFAGPGIAAEWGLGNAGLGYVLAMELIGMAVGSVLLGGVADRIGRKPTIMGCLFAMVIGMFMVTTTSNLVELSIWRVLTGLGIGGMLAAINAVAAEFSNTRKRAFAISTMAIGYPVGGVVGGMIVTQLMQHFDWRSVFYFGTAATLCFIPLVHFFMPESVHWQTRKQPEGALAKINATMKRLGHSVITALPHIDASERKKSTSFLFSPTMIRTTVLVTAAYFLHVITLYFILKWTPKLVVDMGFAPYLAGEVLTWASVGGALGCIFFGVLTIRFDLKSLTIFTFVMAWVFTAIFGYAPAELISLKVYVAMAGFFTNAGIVGMYAILAQVFPTHARASGTGFAIGIGRGGSVLSPIMAGYLLQGGLDVPMVALIMGSGSVIAAVLLLGLKLDKGKAEGAQGDKKREVDGSVGSSAVS
ncbi:MAG: MFS transporter [Gammaproteobacteria bacterium]|jgi:benzoate transport|nr:MFS transporter [Gammaproteobacteria bacterium]MBT6042923.1 MFS transporter [Gammaproteobacteria bacterium]